MQKRILTLICVLIFIMAFAGCEKNNTQPDTAPGAEATATQTEDPKLNDETITGKTIINTYGNYMIPIPDEMWDKIEFTRNGALTIITHKTHDSTQQEQNPVLVEVGAVTSGEEYNGESFMQIGDYTFYRSVRFDMPYTAESEDAKEFSELYDMLHQVLNTLELIDMTTITEEANIEEDPCCDLTDTAPAVSEKGQPFGMDDIHAGGFRIGDAKDDVLAKAGAPSNSYDVVMEATGEVRNINEYSFGNLVFVDNKLVVIQVVDDTIEGPRGIHVGMDLNEATQLFATTIELDTDYMTILYRDNVGGDENLVVPPSGVLYKGDMQTLAFAIFTEDSGFDMSADELAEGGYMYVEQYDLVCEFDSEGTMLSYAVRIGAPAE